VAKAEVCKTFIIGSNPIAASISPAMWKSNFKIANHYCPVKLEIVNILTVTS
jgi:hypothetical protein